jgi:hypothetical protein
MEMAAVECYRQRRGNCAKSVAVAWEEELGHDADIAREFEGCGSGKAPGGTCGALLYAAMRLAGADRSEAVKKMFAEGAGGMTRCQDIRGNKALPCVGLAARILEGLSRN